MRRWAVPFGFLCLVLTAAFVFQQRLSSRRAGFPAPDFTLSDLNGRRIRLSDLRGHVVFLNVWATWCPPCREEMPSMERLYRRLQDTSFIMLAVSVDEGGAETVRRFVDRVGISFPVLLDPRGTVPSRYGVTGFPETFIIDRQGQVIQHTIGPEDWDSEAVYQYIVKLLQADSGTTQASGEHAPSGT
jgi:cytochrome c biogenesis protein CcmG/thiol:disulfide interchange protein DsbE